MDTGNRTQSMRDTRREISELIERMFSHGFRPLELRDLMPGNNVLMVDVIVNHAKRHKRFCAGMNGITKVQLGLPAIREESTTKRQRVVEFTCIYPRQEKTIAHPLEDVLLVGYTHQGTNRNDIRWFVKI